VPAIPLDRLRARARELRATPGGPSGRAVERALNDVYAEVIALEVTRTRLRRRVDDPAGADSGRDAATLRRLDDAIAELRAVLAELRTLPLDATPRRAVR
jgi:hypothetical protein